MCGEHRAVWREQWRRQAVVSDGGQLAIKGPEGEPEDGRRQESSAEKLRPHDEARTTRHLAAGCGPPPRSHRQREREADGRQSANRGDADQRQTGHRANPDKQSTRDDHKQWGAELKAAPGALYQTRREDEQRAHERQDAGEQHPATEFPARVVEFRRGKDNIQQRRVLGGEHRRLDRVSGSWRVDVRRHHLDRTERGLQVVLGEAGVQPSRRGQHLLRRHHAHAP